MEEGLKIGVINEEIFDREISMCKKLSNERGGKCAWGKCADCGVIPLLYKLHEGKLLEEPEEIDSAKEKIFKN